VLSQPVGIEDNKLGTINLDRVISVLPVGVFPPASVARKWSKRACIWFRRILDNRFLTQEYNTRNTPMAPKIKDTTDKVSFAAREIHETAGTAENEE
jgi:hypothetical protein